MDKLVEDLVARSILTRSENRNPIFDTMFSLQNFETRAGSIPGIELPGLKLTPYDSYKTRTSRFGFDLFLIVNDLGDKILMELEYLTALFEESTVREIKKYYMEIVDQVLKNKEIKLKDITISNDLLEVKSQAHQDEFSNFGF